VSLGGLHTPLVCHRVFVSPQPICALRGVPPGGENPLLSSHTLSRDTTTVFSKKLSLPPTPAEHLHQVLRCTASYNLCVEFLNRLCPPTPIPRGISPPHPNQVHQLFQTFPKSYPVSQPNLSLPNKLSSFTK